MKRELQRENLRFWGWGRLDEAFDSEKASAFLEYLKNFYNLKELLDTSFEPELKRFSIPKSDLPEAFVQRWQKKGLSLDLKDRLLHSVGKSYRDLIRIRNFNIARFPDGVLFVEQISDLEILIKEAQKFKITLIPFGGGTGVVGGTECIGHSDSPVLVVSLRELNQLIQLDKIAMTAKFEAGILGPKLEDILNKKGYTLGHFPQSFEFSTLGGWAATRSAGQNSTKYGKIEDLIQALTVVTPLGTIFTNTVPASATGPSLKQLLIGSEGIYGIITDVTVKISNLPEAQIFFPGFFKTFKDGIHCFREIMQTGLKPSIMRLSDPDESEMLLKISTHQGFKKWFMPYWMKFKDLGNKPCFFMVACEGTKSETHYQMNAVKKLVNKFGGASLGGSFAEKWKKDRFQLPYLRDNLMDHGFFIDTLETASSWSQIQKIYLEMERTFNEKTDISNRLVFGCHLSHCYADGASLYFTFLGLQKKGREIEQWESIKKRATDVIVENGGALSHHHGIGYDHRKWMSKELSPTGLKLLREIKCSVDPDFLLNPGKVL